MLTAKVNPLAQWPKVRRVKPGVLRVKGRCITTGQWALLRVIAFFAVFLLVTSTLAAALLPWMIGLDGYLSSSNPISTWISLLADFRWWLRGLLTQTYPAAGEAMYYNGTSPFDWHLLGAWVVLIWLRRALRYTITASLAVLLCPLLGKPFKVSVTRESVTVHGRFWRRKLQRHGSTGGEVSFRVGGPQYQTGLLRLLMRMGFLRASPENELMQVMVVTGLRPVTVATPRKQLDAERIVQSLQLAMQHSRNTME